MKKYLTGILLALFAAGALGQTALTTTGVQTVTGTKTFQTNKICLAGSTSGTVCVNAPAIAGSTTSIMPVFDQQIIFTGTTAARTVTLPDASFTAARKDAAQTFTGVQTFSSAPVLSTTSDTQVLYNDGGSVVGSSNLVFDKTVKKLTVGSGGFGILGSGSGATTIVSRTGVTATATLPGSSVDIAGLSSAVAGRVQFGSGTAGLLSDSTNFFWDNSNMRLGIGTAGSPQSIFDINDTQNSNVFTRLWNKSTGTAAVTAFLQYAGTGADFMELDFFGQNYTTAGLITAKQARLASTGNVHLAPATYTVISVAGVEGMRVDSTGVVVKDGVNMPLGTTTGTKIGTAASQKLGLWNATPIVQPTTAGAAATFVTNTSGTVNDTATFDGYTIGQVVKALRNAGLLQ